VQAVEELKKKLQGLKDLYLAQLQSFRTAVHAHEAVSTSTFKTLECTVAAHPAALEQVCSQNSVMVHVVLDSIYILELYGQSV
jgi:hypothetical protein